MDGLLEGVLFVRVDYELCIRDVNGLSVSSYLDAGCCVWDTPDADDNFQLSTTFLT